MGGVIAKKTIFFRQRSQRINDLKMVKWWYTTVKYINKLNHIP